MKAKSVYFFPNGNTTCCDEKGQQIGELQEPWILLWIKHMQDKGYTPEDLTEIHTPSGRVRLYRITEDDGSIRYNWGSL